MKKYRKSLILAGIIMLFIWHLLQASLFDDRYPSARSSAMGGSGAAVANDVWAAYYNPAGLSQLSRPVISTSYLRLYNVSFFSNFFGAAAYPLPGKYGTASVTFQYFGVNYKDKNISGEYTMALSHGFYLLKDIHSSLSFGYSLKAYNWSLGESLEWGDLGSATTFGLDIGLLASIYTRTYMGVYILNINSPQIGAYSKHDLPQRVVVGLAYKPYDGVTTSLDFNRTIGVGQMQLWGGAEFAILSNLSIRMGATTNPNRFSAGLGLHFAQFFLDYALLTHAELGETHEVGLSVEF